MVLRLLKSRDSGEPGKPAEGSRAGELGLGDRVRVAKPPPMTVSFLTPVAGS